MDKNGSYQIVTTFKKPLGEQPIRAEPSPPVRAEPSPPVRKPVPRRQPPPKRIPTPPTRDETPVRQVTPVRPAERVVTPPPVRPTEPMQEEAHTPRIYTEETVVIQIEFSSYKFLMIFL